MTAVKEEASDLAPMAHEQGQELGEPEPQTPETEAGQAPAGQTHDPALAAQPANMQAQAPMTEVAVGTASPSPADANRYDGGYEDEDETDEYAMGANIQSVFDWSAFLEGQADAPDAPPAYLLKGLRFAGKLGGTVRLECDNESQLNQLGRMKAALDACLSRHCSEKVSAEIVLSEKARNNAQLQGAPPNLDRPELRHCFEILGAHVERVQRR